MVLCVALLIFWIVLNSNADVDCIKWLRRDIILFKNHGSVYFCRSKSLIHFLLVDLGAFVCVVWTNETVAQFSSITDLL